MLRLFESCVVALLFVVPSAGCATKNFVHASVDRVGENVETLAQSLEQTQQRVERNAARIETVAAEVAAAQQNAQQAVADAASAAELAKKAAAQAEALDEARGKLLYEVVSKEQEGGFEFGSAELPDTAKKQLDDLVVRLKQEPTNAFITIEGYTDSIGRAEINERLARERAEAVRRYLYEQHQVPLHRMDVIGYGEQNPMAPNRTRAGRAQNRRVEVKVLS